MLVPLEIVKSVLLGLLDVDIAIGDLQEFMNETREISKYSPLLRALQALRDNKMVDFCGHLRQCMNYFTCGFEITKELYDKVFGNAGLFGFIFNNHSGYTINIQPQILPDINDLKSTYRFEKRREYKTSIADGRLYRYFRYTTYTSLSQKLLMYFIANMEQNETLLVCLPTGGGKSLSWQLPAISNAYCGTIIVVVPTIALAIDHERTSKALYDSVFAAENYPHAYYSGVEYRKKRDIYNGIEAGTIPVLYISPEALQNKDFQDKVMVSASKGQISALIIDEAHLIVNWGIRFRPEFQLLSSFRNNLKQNSPAGIKTILLSATYTNEDTEIIKTIFDDKIFTEYRADELRPELVYYLHKCVSEAERKDLVNKLVCLVPRPLIVYTVGPEEGIKYFNSIKSLGYENIAMFTGQTGNNDRQAIIEDWNKDKIDIIVATSAFGMGVDKSDIRTVITAYTPETISRFYQEVGRAGRDGYTALNYFLPFDGIDDDYVASLTKSKVLTVDSLVNRWKELLTEAQHQTPDTVWIDINVPPEHLKFSKTGRRNAGWNKDIILLLFRAGLIEIIEANNVNHDDYKILIKLKKINILENSDLLTEYIAKYREAERERINNGIFSVKELIKSEKHDCYSRYLVDEFPYSAASCNGCPHCRKHGFGSVHNNGSIIVNSTKSRLANDTVVFGNGSFSSLLRTSRSIMLTINHSLHGPRLCNYIEHFIKKGVNVIITPKSYNQEKLLEALSCYDIHKYLILSLQEALRIEIKWLNGICALVYTDNDDDNQVLYAFSERYLEENLSNKVIHVAKCNQYINSEFRLLSEIIDQSLNGESIFL